MARIRIDTILVSLLVLVPKIGNSLEARLKLFFFLASKINDKGPYKNPAGYALRTQATAMAMAEALAQIPPSEEGKGRKGQPACKALSRKRLGVGE